MSFLRKIIATIRPDHGQKATEGLVLVMPAENQLTAEAAQIDRRVAEPEEDENPTKQRRYYVKTGRYVDYEEEVSTQAASGQAVVRFDKAPADLKSLFPRLSLR